MVLQRFIFLFFFACQLVACKQVSETKQELPILPLQDELFACQSPEEVLAFLKKYPYLREFYFDNGSESDSLLSQKLYHNIRNKDLFRFKQQLDSLFSDNSGDLADELGSALQSVKSTFPDFKIPRVMTLVSGFMGKDLYLSDSLIIIGLDYFGGPSARYRPDVYEYQLRRYNKESIVPSILLILSDKYNYSNPEDRTLLGEMVGYGKAFEFVKKIVPQTPDSLIIGYSQENLDRTYSSQTELWAFFINNKLLYETNELKKQKYVSERPYTNEIGPEVPGAIGRWIGWRIVSLYQEKHPDIGLPELMKNGNAVQILQESGYKGQTDN